MRFIVDTDVCIDFLKGLNYAVRLFEEIAKYSHVNVSILTYYELLKGAFSDKERKIIEEFVELVGVINIDEKIVRVAGKFYRDYRKKGITLSNIDCLIMATAKVYGYKVITRNISDYPEKDLLFDINKFIGENK